MGASARFFCLSKLFWAAAGAAGVRQNGRAGWGGGGVLERQGCVGACLAMLGLAWARALSSRITWRRPACPVCLGLPSPLALPSQASHRQSACLDLDWPGPGSARSRVGLVLGRPGPGSDWSCASLFLGWPPGLDLLRFVRACWAPGGSGGCSGGGLLGLVAPRGAQIGTSRRQGERPGKEALL